MKGQPGKQALAILDNEGSDNKEPGYQNIEGSYNHHKTGFVAQSQDGDKVARMVEFGFFGLEKALGAIHIVA